MDLRLEVFLGLLLAATQVEDAAEVLDVFDAAQFGDSGAFHHGEEIDEEVGVPAYHHVGSERRLFEFFEHFRALWQE